MDAIADPRVRARLLVGTKIDEQTGCWVWQMYHDRCGYGRIKVSGRAEWTHRVAYAACVGPIPELLTVDHIYHNRLCVNPAHLQLLSRSENCRRNQHHARYSGS